MHKIKVIDNFITENDITIAKTLIDNSSLISFKGIPHIFVTERSNASIDFLRKYAEKSKNTLKEIYNISVPLYTFEGELTLWNEGAGTAVHHDNHSGAEMVQLTTVIYLNDEYEGGEIYFPEFDFEHKPKTGQAIFFPAFSKDYEYTHGVKDIAGAKRYTIALWFTALKEYADPIFLTE